MVEAIRTLDPGRVAEIRAQGKERLRATKERWKQVRAVGLGRNAASILSVADWLVIAGVTYFAGPDTIFPDTDFEIPLAFIVMTGVPMAGAARSLGGVVDILSTHMSNKMNLLTAAKFVRRQVNAELRFAELPKSAPQP